jgi:hypothetical protein
VSGSGARDWARLACRRRISANVQPIMPGSLVCRSPFSRPEEPETGHIGGTRA